jgi:hypothetical protein
VPLSERYPVDTSITLVKSESLFSLFSSERSKTSQFMETGEQRKTLSGHFNDELKLVAHPVRAL